MPSTIFKVFTASLISAALLGLTYIALHACAGGDWECDDESYSFFDPKIIDQPQVSPFFVTCHSLYDGEYANEETLDNLNEKEWETELHQQLDATTLHQIFNLNKVDVDSIFGHVNKTAPYFTNEVQDKTKRELIEKLIALNNKPVVDYFQFSKKVERIMYGHDYWDYENKAVDTLMYVAAVDEAKQAMVNTKSKFLKTRYAFQVQRLLFYLNRYDDCATWYTEKLNPLNPSGTLHYRTMAYYAGCLYHKKQYAISNYLFSLIYDQFYPLKIDAFTSFHPWEDADWNSTLSMAKSTHEREVLWQLFGVFADPLKGMKEIYAINPKSAQLDLLLTRAINIYERQQMPNSEYQNSMEGNEDPLLDTASNRKVFDSSNSFNAFKTSAAQKELTTFIKTVADKNNTNNYCLWLNAAAYLCWMNNNYKESEKYLNRLEKCNPISELNKSQMAITTLLVKYGKIEKFTPQSEQQLYDLIANGLDKFPNEKSQKVYQYILQNLNQKYTSQGKTLMAELCSASDRDYYKEEENMDVMLKFMRQPNHTNWEKYLLDQYRIKAYNIIEYKAINELKDFHFDAALKWFEMDSLSGSAMLYANPFTIHINDCHDCDFAAPQKMKYTKYSFTLKLKELLTKAETAKDSNEKAQNYFLFANGLYNMTYYGNGRMITSCYDFTPIDYNTIDWSTYKTPDPDESGGCEFAMANYEKARTFATKKEFAAKCAWMCAKCQLNNSYSSINDEDFVSPDSGYYKVMRDSYSDTKYFKEVITECGYFCSYMGGGDECIRNK